MSISLLAGTVSFGICTATNLRIDVGTVTLFTLGIFVHVICAHTVVLFLVVECAATLGINFTVIDVVRSQVIFCAGSNRTGVCGRIDEPLPLAAITEPLPRVIAAVSNTIANLFIIMLR